MKWQSTPCICFYRNEYSHNVRWKRQKKKKKKKKKKTCTFIVEAVSAHDALVDAEDVTPGNLISVTFVSQIADSHVL